jgi:hypothetical protein
MTLSATCSSAEARAYIHGHVATTTGQRRGLPPLPFPLNNEQLDAIRGIEDFEPLDPAQRGTNLLVVALWITEFDQANLDMQNWHTAFGEPESTFVDVDYGPDTAETLYHACGTVHCIAGFAQAMAGQSAFVVETEDYAPHALPPEAVLHFWDTNEDALAYLREVVRRHEKVS